MAPQLYRGFHATPAMMGLVSSFQFGAKAQGMSFAYFEVCAGNVPGNTGYTRSYGSVFGDAGIKVGPYHRFARDIPGKEQARAFVRTMTDGAPHSMLESGYMLRPGLYIPDGTMPNLVDHIYDWVNEVTQSLYANKGKAILPILMASQRTIDVGQMAGTFIQKEMALWLHGGSVEDMRRQGWTIPMWLRESDFPIADQLLPLDMATELGPTRFELFPKVGIEAAPFIAGAASVAGAWYVKNVIFKRRP